MRLRAGLFCVAEGGRCVGLCFAEPNSTRMLTFFTTAKAFLGHDGIIQRNALASWKRLDPSVEVILFGDDAGSSEVCAEMGLRHEPGVARHESGAKYLHTIFRRAQEIARHEYLCFSNCDIILTEDFRQGFEKTRAWREKFLLVSRRWDVDITAPIDFERAECAREVRELALGKGFRQDESWIDFFLFRKGMYSEIPAMIVGHCYWDNWMIWRALRDGVPVVDGDRFVIPVHQNHGYNAKYGRVKGVPTDALSQFNLRAIGGEDHIRRIDAATHRIARGGEIRRVLFRNTYKLRETMTYKVRLPIWHGILGVTRPMRNALGLRSKA
jgi:hypothetical protein